GRRTLRWSDTQGKNRLTPAIKVLGEKMPLVAFTHCPDCGYDLHGLPARHRCPECGFEYDEHTRVWRPANPTKLYKALFISSACLIAQFLTCDYRAHRGLWRQLLLLVLTVATAVLLVWHFSRSIRNNRLGRCLVISPQGIFVRSSNGTAMVPWRAVREVS